MAATMATGSRVLFLSCGFAFLLLLFSMECVHGANSSVVIPHHPDKGTHGSTKLSMTGLRDRHLPFTDEQHYQILNENKRQNRMGRKQKINEELPHADYDDLRNQLKAIVNSKRFITATRGKYSVWRREHGSGKDTLLIWMKDQVILGRVLTRVAHENKNGKVKRNLTMLVKDSLDLIGEANSDTELKEGAMEQALKMHLGLAEAKKEVYDCEVVAKKLRAMIKTIEEAVMALKRKAIFLMQVASWTTSKPLHCLHLQLTNDYFLHDHSHMKSPDKGKTEDPSLYHYAIFSDNVLATSVVIGSAIDKAKEPENHVFHIVTDRLNFAAMQMWFINNPPLLATVEVESIDKFKWLNSSYSPVLQQLELAVLDEDVKLMNPKYLSMLNHLRFYIPELFPKLNKILFLDDDVVVQKDLTPLWVIDMKGLVNGAVETCKKNLHDFGSYLNFSNMKISQNFNPHACGWAFGMNIFDLKQWRLHNLTGVYHYWQDLIAWRLPASLEETH
ncbi:putative galacturonosyltransferase 3 [Iris pallida]|uniref:Hexosyltransferase n=1 Tax=Iris pallida TaxID=29817 RepID=A0AAX6I8M2_IRIPA|nr:putative galacturonosyltransferase 3 [Iris pallida]KAJ6849570.1 putative galacturonosyltransferase 3 [Iris pallida]